MTIKCSNYSYQVDESVLFCSECKQPLAPISGLGTFSVNPEVLRNLATGSLEGRQPGLVSKLEARVSLHIPDQDDVFPPVDQEAFILGHINEGQFSAPDIDTEGYETYESGVSCLHASIDVGGKDRVRLVLLDIQV